MKVKKLKKKIIKLAKKYGYLCSNVDSFNKDALGEISLNIQDLSIVISDDSFTKDDHLFNIYVYWKLIDSSNSPYFDLDYKCTAKKAYKFIKGMCQKSKKIKNSRDESDFLRWILKKTTKDIEDYEMVIKVIESLKSSGRYLFIHSPIMTGELKQSDDFDEFDDFDYDYYDQLDEDRYYSVD